MWYWNALMVISIAVIVVSALIYFDVRSQSRSILLSDYTELMRLHYRLEDATHDLMLDVHDVIKNVKIPVNTGEADKVDAFIGNVAQLRALRLSMKRLENIDGPWRVDFAEPLQKQTVPTGDPENGQAASL